MKSRVETFKQGAALSFEYKRRRYKNARLGNKRRSITVFSQLGHFNFLLVFSKATNNSFGEKIMWWTFIRQAILGPYGKILVPGLFLGLYTCINLLQPRYFKPRINLLSRRRINNQNPVAKYLAV